MASTRRVILLAHCLVALVACRGTDGIVFDDGGVDAAPAVDASLAPRPEVTETTPADGAADVEANASIEVRFSTPMAARGAATVTSREGELAIGDGAWATPTQWRVEAPAEGGPRPLSSPCDSWASSRRRAARS